MRPAFGSAAFVLMGACFGACVAPLPGGALEGTGGAGGQAGLGGGGGSGAAMGGSGAAQCTPASCTQHAGCTEPAWIGSPVSSFETACGGVDPVDGRDGGWFIYTTAASTASPAPTEPFRVTCGGADGSCFSACVSGKLNGNGAGDWPTVGIGFTPHASGGSYDASRYGRIDFWMYAIAGPGSTFRLLVPLRADTMVGNGDGTCTANCFDAYNIPLPAQPIWQHLTIPFDALTQQGFGPPEPWDPTTVMSFQWAVAATASPNLVDEPYAICIDQVQLLP